MRATAVGVVVPVHDEEELLARCLPALRAAAAGCGVPVHVVLVLDACTDGSAAVAAAAGELATTTALLRTDGRCVGRARALGCRALLARVPDSRGLWLATTDADSAVPPEWLSRVLAYATQGYDAVAGTVVVDDWSPHGAHVRTAYTAGYQPRWDHRHVHGANLAVSAAAYEAAGGFPPVGCHEDVGLVAALLADGHAVAWADDLPVRTSARDRGRAPGGFSGFLRALAEPERADPAGTQRADSAMASLIDTRPPLRSSAPA